jgi:hypothetical protein
MVGKCSQKYITSKCVSYCNFHRYIDDIFITWNKSEQLLIKFLKDANTWHPNIKLDYKIGKSLPFLDVLLTNNNGINIIKTSLTRAIRYSSTFQAFNYERRHIKLTLLYNG